MKNALDRLQNLPGEAVDKATLLELLSYMVMQLEYLIDKQAEQTE